MSIFKKAAAVVIASTVLLAGCSGGDTTWVAKSGDDKISSGTYIVYEIQAIDDAQTKYSEESGITAGTASLSFDQLLGKTIEGKTAAQWIEDEALVLSKQHLAIADQFKKRGLEMTPEEKAVLDQSVSEGSNAFYTKNGVSNDSLIKVTTSFIQSDRLFDALYGEGGEFEVPESEVKSEMTKRYAMGDVIYIYDPELSSGVTNSEKTTEQIDAELKKQADDLLARLKAGEDIYDLAHEQQLAMASEENKDSVTKPNEGELAMVVAEDHRDVFGDAFVDAALKANIGDAFVEKSGDFYLLFRKGDILTNQEVYDVYKDIVLQEMKQPDFEAKLNEWVAAMQIEINDAAIAKYKASNVKFDEAK